MKYELWKESGGYSFFPEDNASMRSLLGTEAVMLWTVEANSWEEAQSKKHEFLGWEPYKPIASSQAAKGSRSPLSAFRKHEV